MFARMKRPLVYREADTLPPSRIFFANLDGLRFVAFMLVFLQHAFSDLVKSIHAQGPLFRLFQHNLTRAGEVGVAFFFSLSGFLITYLILNEIVLTRTLDVRAFYVRRILRIWPLYFLIVAFAFIGYPLLGSLIGMDGSEPGNPLFFIFFLSNFAAMDLKEAAGAMVGVTLWSVAVEEQFYILWPLLFYFLRSQFYSFIFLGVILGSALFRFYYIHDQYITYFHTFSIISDMAVGGLAAYLSFTSRRFVRFFANLSAPAIAAIYVAGFTTILFNEQIFTGPILLMLKRLIFSFCFVFIILEQNYAQKSLFKMSQLKSFTFLGKYTYGLYLFHPIVLVASTAAMRLVRLDPTTVPNGLLRGVIALGLTIAISYLSYHIYERPFLRMKERFSHVVSTRSRQAILPQAFEQ